MLSPDDDERYKLTDEDERVYRRFLPDEHPLLDALELIPWDSFIPDLEAFYSRKDGQPAFRPLLMFKLEFLRYFCRLGDREVITRSTSDVLFRWFLQVPIRFNLPHPTSLTRFRGRLGAEGYRKLFDRLIAHAREANLIRDRLRLKDATHVVANIAVPTTLTLLAQLRDRMLQVIASIDPEVAEGFQIAADNIHQETAGAEEAIRLEARLALVIDILAWIQEQSPPPKDDDPRWKKLYAVRQLAEKITADFLNPGRGHRTLSIVDPDARRGRHGEFYDGYMLDVMMDADSELITALEVLPADGDEAADAIHLVAMEEETHDNHIEQLSMDGAGFNGPVLRQLEDPKGHDVRVFTPPRDFRRNEGFPSSMFELSADGSKVTCPQGETSHYCNTGTRHGATYQFKRVQCQGCAQLPQCHPNMKPEARFGRSVTKSHYEADYERARERAKTEEYAEVRRRHPAIERKLNEIVRHRGGRRATYRGRAKVFMQQCMACFVANVRRIGRLHRLPVCAAPS